MKYRTAKMFGVIGAVTGTVWMASKVISTRQIVDSAFDTSITDIYEPYKSPHEAVSDQYFYLRYMKSGYAEDFLSNCGNFFRFMFARRLLNIACCDNRSLRLRAVEHLSEMRLDGWQHSLVAHMCDARTAVGIARSRGSDYRNFLRPPRKYGMYNSHMLILALKDYLKALDRAHSHPCIEKVVSNLLLEAEDADRIIDQHHGEENLSSRSVDPSEIIMKCLTAIRHHSYIPAYGKDVLNEHGLYLLMEVYHRYSDNTHICIFLCNIIANIAVFKTEVLEEIFKSGWISVLAKWISHPDLRIAGPATQALANLDEDDVLDEYATNLYLMYPKYRTTDNLEVDVVFIHGLMGNVFYTWRNLEDMEATLDFIGKLSDKKESIGLDSYVGKGVPIPSSSDPALQEYMDEVKAQLQSDWDAIGNDFEFVFHDIPINTNDKAEGPYAMEKNKILDIPKTPTQCWPSEWLPNDCGHLRIIGLNYHTSLTAWVDTCPMNQEDVSIDIRSKTLLDKLIKAGVGTRPIVWITHSMGGIIVKNILGMAKESDSPVAKNIVDRSKAIFFYSTPHRGSKLANLHSTTSLVIWPSKEVMELREDSLVLKKIHEKFLDLLKDNPIEIYSFIETKPTLMSALKITLTLVDISSANLSIGQTFEIPQNHLGICKPSNRESFLYQKVLGVIKKIVREQKRA